MFAIARLIALIYIAALPLSTPATAQDGGRSILVLDASGSMWGQINGTAKITIAQQVVDQLLREIPADQRLGLTAYGHRRKGDCTDIETLVEPATGNRAEISHAVNSLKPKGKTPLSAAVIKAAEALRYTEQQATVILVSDGKETCNLNTCEVGAQLEAAGVDFTAHVVGFDVAKPKIKAQLRCLAENTGGQYHDADSAGELSSALSEISQPALPQDRDVRLVAIDGPDGYPIYDGIAWQISNDETGETPVAMIETDVVRATLKEGSYTAQVTRFADEATVTLALAITADGPRNFRLVLPPLKPPASLTAPDSAPAGATISVVWSGPGEARDFLSTANTGDRGTKTITLAHTRNGSPLDIQLPAEVGSYELRYVHGATGRVLAMHMIEVTALEFSLNAPDTALAGATVEVIWQGPGYKGDRINVAEIGSRDTAAINSTYAAKGSPLGLEMPVEPGEYEIRYLVKQGSTILVSRMITVLPVSANIAPPSDVAAGSEFSVEWTGPAYKLDRITIAEIGSRGSKSVDYAYVSRGSPIVLEAPDQPGEYEIRYVMHQRNTVLARVPLTIK